MNNCLIRNARVYNTALREFFYGSVLVMGGKIAVLHRGNVAEAPEGVEVFDACGCMLIPGLVDIHTHGRAGGDFNTADEETMLRMADSYLAGGVTTVMPTLASATMESLTASIHRINTLRAASEAAEGKLPFIAGTHLEGRYLSVKRRGAHAEALLAPLDPEELESLLSLVEGERHVSAALEREGGEEFLARAKALGATVSLGHSDADFDTACRLIELGVTGLTHTFNAMPPLHHRDGGVVAAGLLSDTALCEMICDGYHIAPHMVRLAYRLAGRRLTLITDSMEATGCPDGEYSIAGNPVTVKDGKARTHDGAIAGSTLSLWEAVRNLQSFAGTSIEEAIYAATMAPAREIGLEREIGSIEIGKRADLLVLDDRDTVSRILCGGWWKN
jgi:N-acetylglucosamine-6-phosphate deacetylase